MIQMHKYAAIDIGSNAVRLLLAVIAEPAQNPIKITWARMPIRLGEDAFLLGRISDEKANQLKNTINGFKYLIEAFQPLDFMACATAAMRTADNGQEICHKIFQETGISIDIIDGRQEASFLFKNKPKDLFSEKEACLLIDVGGGSTEMTLFYQGRRIASESFNLGAIRLFKKQADPLIWEAVEHWVKDNTAGYNSIVAIGSGGNINKLFRLAKGKKGKPVSCKTLTSIYKLLRQLSIDQRIKQFRLRPDRADVIVPASEIYLKIMQWSGCRNIHVPMLGLSDGMIRVLHERRSGIFFY
ncbi:MAG: exopolyphosphatase [Desulfobacula sp.]|jgi:exopolyphosphatase / guanosine-5'-triphosphate,3'-diphosphate pyrophosphatase|nr:exopolyphosphatase [Desulfobacula sp.]